MTKFIVLICLFVAGFGWAQEKATFNHHFWAGGVCCTSGTDYTLSIAFPAKDFTCFDSLKIETDGILLVVPDNALALSKRGDSLLIYTCKFGYSSNNAYDRYEGGRTSYYGMTEKDLREWTEHSATKITLIHKRKEDVVLFPEVTESMTAYP